MYYYTYAYLREDKTPYYIGKGKGNRIYSKSNRRIKPPKDKSRIIFLKQNLTEAEAFRHEIYMIDVFGRKDLGTGILYNRTDGGDGSSGWVPSEENKKNISEANKNPSEETRRKMSEAKKGHTYRLGKTHSEKTKQIIKKKRANQIFTEEHRRKLSEANKGENNPNYGKTASEETKRKLSDIHKNRIFSEKHRKKLSEAHKNPSKETRRKLSEAKKGRKWWNDGCGKCKMMLECPGDGWKLGRK